MSWSKVFALLLLASTGCDGDGSGRVRGTDPSGTTPSVTTPDVTVPTSPADPDAPTWYQDVAPLMSEHCGACHREGGQGPFSIETYEQALPWGPAMSASIASGQMPPFYAVEDASCDPRLGWLEDISLTEDEKQLVYDWVEADMPEGDPTIAAPAELTPVAELDPVSAELAIQEPFVVEGDGDIYQCFRIPMPNTSKVYLTGVQVEPENELVVHHVIVWNDPNDASEGQAGEDGSYGCSGFPDIFPTEIVGTWTPGSGPMLTPPGTATPMEVGSSLVLNIHYHPTGTTTELDQTKIKLQWTEQEPDMYATWFLVDTVFGAIVQPGMNDDGRTEFRIPPNVADHVETVEMWFTRLLFTADMTVFAITPHMHYLGTDMLVNIDPEGTDDPDECLIHTPGFRFDFQRDYRYDSSTGPLPVIHPGDKVRVQCMYDNSVSNPFLPLHLEASDADAPHDVYWGEETGDEMCMAILGLIVPKDGWSPFSWF
jgi:hypothetical protein